MTDIAIPDDGRLRILSFAAADGQAKLGLARKDGTVLPVAEAAQKVGLALSFADFMAELIKAGAQGLGELRELVLRAKDEPGLPVSAVSILPPLPKLARNIFCVGWNYLDHFEEGRPLRDPSQKLPAHPVFFTKATSALNAPFGSVPYDANVSAEIDFEVELAAVIGKKGRNITEADAPAHVFGYTILNDMTARDLQKAKHGGQWFKGKSLDGHAPMGPWIVPADEIDPDAVHLRLYVNGVVKQDGVSAQMYFKIPRIIAELSAGLTLEPGDVIATGTPPGVGAARTPPEFLRPGDVMETEIAEIGRMRHVIGAG